MSSILGMSLMMAAPMFAQQQNQTQRKALKERATEIRNKPTNRRRKVKDARKAKLKNQK